jgi:hypothetical protein
VNLRRYCGRGLAIAGGLAHEANRPADAFVASSFLARKHVFKTFDEFRECEAVDVGLSVQSCTDVDASVAWLKLAHERLRLAELAGQLDLRDAGCRSDFLEKPQHDRILTVVNGFLHPDLAFRKAGS